jgi:hypothetical protein
MSPPDYDANLVPAPSLTREFEAIPGYKNQVFLPVNMCSNLNPHPQSLNQASFDEISS